MNSIDLIYEKLLSIDFQRVLFGDLVKFGERAGNYTACCPFHEDKSPSFSISREKPLWNCFSGCGGGNWFDYLERKNGFSFRESLEFLAQHAGISLELSEDETKKNEQLHRKQSLFEVVQTLFQDELLSSEGNHVMKYLQSRGYSLDDCQKMNVGAFPSPSVIRDYCGKLGFSQDELANSGLFASGFGTTHKLTLPFRDTLGKIKGFIVRVVPSEEYPQAEPKYKFTSGTDKSTFFGSERIKNSNYVVVTEGFLDAALAHARGVSSVVGIGQSTISQAQFEHAKKLGIKRLLLALDNDHAGRNGTEKAIKDAINHGISTFVVNFPSSCKDPDEFIISFGIDEFRAAIAHAQRGSVWLSSNILRDKNINNDIERDELKRTFLDLSLKFSDSQDVTIIKNVLRDIFKLDEAALEREYLHLQELRNREIAHAEYTTLLRESQVLVRDGNLERLEDLLRERISEISSISHSVAVERYSFQTFLQEIRNSPDGLRTGYPELDKVISLRPGAITIISGRPRHGKTSFMLNLLFNSLYLNTKKRFLFFSYEEPRRDIVLKLIIRGAQRCINPLKNLQTIEYYFRNGNPPKPEPSLDKTAQEIGSLLENERLQVIDEPLTVEQFSAYLEKVVKTSHEFPVGGVFVDYIQKMKISGKFQSRQVELQKVSERILETAKSLNIPIILGAQLNRESTQSSRPKLEHLRESGDIENDANTVLGVYNPSAEPMDGNESALYAHDPVPFEIHVLKNRGGQSNVSTKLFFNRPTLEIVSDPATASRDNNS